MKSDSVNWTSVQDLFFDKILKKQETSHNFSISTKGNRGEDVTLQTENKTNSYQSLLLDASRKMMRFKNPWRLIKVINRIIEQRIGVTHCAILIFDNKRNSYVLADSRGVDGKRIPRGFVRLDLKSPLVELFQRKEHKYYFENGVLNFKELWWILESGQLLIRDVYFHNRLRLALKEMELLDAELCVPCFFKKNLLGLLILGKKTTGRSFKEEEADLFATLADDAAVAIANARLMEDLKKKVDEAEHLYEKEHKLFLDTVVALAKTIDARDIYTHGHTERVTRYCLAIADELRHIPEVKLNNRFDETLHITALLHDIGKIGVPDDLLNKKGKLSAVEMKVVERHPEIGKSILFPIGGLKEAAMCVYSHQEWYNGNGYPNGLKREEIPLMARIVSVADAFDAMTSDRPYRKKKKPEYAMEEIIRCSGSQFDPKVVEAFLKVYKKGVLNSEDCRNSVSKISYSSRERLSQKYPSSLF